MTTGGVKRQRVSLWLSHFPVKCYDDYLDLRGGNWILSRVGVRVVVGSDEGCPRSHPFGCKNPLLFPSINIPPFTCWPFFTFASKNFKIPKPSILSSRYLLLFFLALNLSTVDQPPKEKVWQGDSTPFNIIFLFCCVLCFLFSFFSFWFDECWEGWCSSL